MTNASFAFQKDWYLSGHCGLPPHRSEPDTGPPQQSKWAVRDHFAGLEKRSLSYIGSCRPGRKGFESSLEVVRSSKARNHVLELITAPNE